MKTLPLMLFVLLAGLTSFSMTGCTEVEAKPLAVTYYYLPG